MQIGPYEVIRALGGGGMSEAILARSPQGRVVVLKRPLKREAELLARLRDEARLGSRLFHPHLVETLDVLEHDGMPVLVLGFVEGPTVDELRKVGPVGPAAAARVGCHVAEALSALHGALGDDGKPMRAVHRDVTARNIVVRVDGDAVLIDLGIARSDDARHAQTETGMVLGTLRYLAPEIINGLQASPASDVWALGCVVFELATGSIAFSGSPAEIAGRITTLDPLTLPHAQGVDPQLRAVLAQMFVKDPEKRIGEAHEASKALRQVEEALGGGKPELARRATESTSAVETSKFPQPDSGPIAPLHSPLHSPLHAPPHVPLAASPPESSSPSPRPPAVSLDAAPPRPTPVSLDAPAMQDDAPARAAALAAAPTPVFDRAPPPPRAPVPLARPLSAASPLELDRAPITRRATRVDEGPARADFYPKKKLDLSWLTGGLARIAFWVVVVGVIIGGYQYWKQQEANEQQSAADYKREQDNKLLQDAMKDTGATCSGTGNDDGWAYEDARGTTIVVERLSQVPKRFVKGARCVRLGGRR